MLDDDLTAFLESGCSTIVGFVLPGGEPFASRGWAVHVLGPRRLRVLVGEGAMASIGLRPGDGASFAIAVTGADVHTLRSVQVKGTAHDLEPPTDDDLERSRRFCDAFFADVEAVDAFPRALMERLVPADLVACTVEVTDVFDQTPGPAAGAPLSTASP